ncbi:MAG: sulfatase-like hydrolase/transferase, partial [Desulfobulbaceae bacterium]
MESWPNHQGFDFAAFPIHQQGQLTVFNDDAAAEGIAVGIGKDQYDDRFTLDHWFRPDPAHMATVVEGKRGEKVREVHMQEGERWNQQKYNDMNERFQRQALEHLGILAKQDEPFFLQYWPVIPLSNPRHTVDKFTSPNGGTYVESMQQLDGWVGEIMDAVDRLGIADNTVVVLMGDNGHFTKYSPGSGFTPMIFRGGKADTTEGGVRVDAFVRWPGMIEQDSVVADIVHVTDLYTSLARLADAADGIPTDRLVDGVDQSALMLVGETHGRRDTVFLYSGNKLEAVVKEQFKLNEVCKYANVQPYMLRFWGTEFPQLEAEKSGTGQRLYSRDQVELILEIRRLLFDEGLTIAGARKKITAMEEGGSKPKAKPKAKTKVEEKVEAEPKEK